MLSAKSIAFICIVFILHTATHNQSLTYQLNWTKIGEVTGSSTLQLPKSFNELYVEILAGGTKWNTEFNIPFITLKDQTKDYFCGFYASQTNSLMTQISVSKKNICMLSIIRGGTLVLNSSAMTVYYR